MYVFPWFSHSWTSRRILAIETFLDLFMALAMFSVFFVDLTLIGGQCDQNVLGCGTFTWLLTWLFFHAASWFAGLVFDGTAWHRGLSTSQEIDGDILLDIRRTTRSHR